MIIKIFTIKLIIGIDNFVYLDIISITIDIPPLLKPILYIRPTLIPVIKPIIIDASIGLIVIINKLEVSFINSG